MALHMLGTWLMPGSEYDALSSLSESEPFGENDWMKFGKIEPALEIPASLRNALNEDCPYFKGKKTKETHLLMFLPSHFNDAALSPDSFRTNVLKCSADSHFFDHHGKTEVTEGYWFLITKLPIPNSSGKSWQDQQKLLKEGYRPPHIIEVALAASLSELKNNQPKLFSNGNYTRCIESSNAWPIAVGLSVDTLDVEFNDWDSRYGLAAVRIQ